MGRRKISIFHLPPEAGRILAHYHDLVRAREIPIAQLYDWAQHDLKYLSKVTRKSFMEWARSVRAGRTARPPLDPALLAGELIMQARAHAGSDKGAAEALAKASILAQAALIERIAA